MPMVAERGRATQAPSLPGERVLDFDIYHIVCGDGDYQRALAEVVQAKGQPVLWTPHNGGHWIAANYEAIAAVLGDEEHFTANQVTVPSRPETYMRSRPLQTDGEEHAKYKALLAPFLTPRAVAALTEQVRDLTIRLIEGFKPRGSCEFVGAFAQHLPIAIFISIAGFPERDRVQLTAWADEVLRGETDEDRNRARMHLCEYGKKIVAERRKTPRSDVLSALIAAEIDGTPIDDETMDGIVTFLLVAGLDTVASTMGFMARFLALNPAHRQELIDNPRLIPDAVEEMLRRFAVVNPARQVREDVEFFGCQLRKGDMMLCPTSLGGLDASRFHDPLTVDFHRPRQLHLSFGGAAHRCMGSMLARTELKIFLEEWLARIPHFRIAPDEHAVTKARQIATVTHLPLEWEV